MSSTIHVEVPTDPMARSVDQLSNHVDGTTGAIVAMKIATIAAEQEAADRVCENVDHGFRSLIASQISQKSARAKAVLDAKLMELMHQKKMLQRVHEQMERDFHRISSRYLKLFNTLDLALKSRIYELDKLPAELVGKEMPKINGRVGTFGGQPFVQQAEGMAATQLMAAARVRRDTTGALSSMVGIIRKTRTLQSAMAGVSDSVRVASARAVLLPVLVFDADDVDSSVRIRKTFVPGGHARIRPRMESATGDAPWGPADGDEVAGIMGRCATRLQHQVVPDRKKKMAMDLLKSLNWQGPGRGAA